MWYVNAAKNNLRLIESILITAYKFVLGLSKNSANKVCWVLGLSTFRRIITKITVISSFVNHTSYAGAE